MLLATLARVGIFGPSLANSAEHHPLPWLVGVDFNTILSREKKLGGLPVIYQETEDFSNCLNECDFYDMGYNGGTFTWWNGRTDKACIFKRLDRVLSNQEIMDEYPNIQVKHLIKRVLIIRLWRFNVLKVLK